MNRASNVYLVFIGLLISFGMLASTLIYYEWVRHFVDALANDEGLYSSCGNGDGAACSQLYRKVSEVQKYSYALYTFFVCFIFSGGLTAFLLRSKLVSILTDTTMILSIMMIFMVGAIVAGDVSVVNALIQILPVVLGVSMACWFLQSSRQNKKFENDAKSARFN